MKQIIHPGERGLCALIGAASVRCCSQNDATLIEEFRHVEVASASDALEQIVGKQLYMTKVQI